MDVIVSHVSQVLSNYESCALQAASGPPTDGASSSEALIGVKRKYSESLPFVHHSGLFSHSINTVADAVKEFHFGVNGYPSVKSVKEDAALMKERFTSTAR